MIGPSVSTFYFETGGTGYPADLTTFFNAIGALFPLGISWSIPAVGDTIDDSNGALVNSWATGTPAVPTSTGSTAWVEGVGARLLWETGAVYRDRKVVGSTFLVPLDRNMFESAGAVVSGVITTATAAGNALIADTSQSLRIWSRPHPGGSDGASFPAIASRVPDEVSWLRSRRT